MRIQTQRPLQPFPLILLIILTMSAAA